MDVPPFVVIWFTVLGCIVGTKIHNRKLMNIAPYCEDELQSTQIVFEYVSPKAN